LNSRCDGLILLRFQKQVEFAYETQANAQAARSELSVVISVTHSDRRLFPVPYSLCCGLNKQAVWVADLHTLIVLYSKMKSKCKLRKNLFVFITNSNFKILSKFFIYQLMHKSFASKEILKFT